MAQAVRCELMSAEDLDTGGGVEQDVLWCAGYDNMEVNLEPVLDYIKAQNYKALEFEQNAKRVASMSKWTVGTLCSAPLRLSPEYCGVEQCCHEQLTQFCKSNVECQTCV